MSKIPAVVYLSLQEQETPSVETFQAFEGAMLEFASIFETTAAKAKYAAVTEDTSLPAEFGSLYM